MFQTVYKKKRQEFGVKPEFTTQIHEIVTIEEKGLLPPTCVSIGVDATRKFNIQSVNTTKVDYSHKQVLHVEGGWPKEVDYTDNEQTSRYRKKIEKDEHFIKSVVQLGKLVEEKIMLSNAMNIFEKDIESGSEMQIVYSLALDKTFSYSKKRAVKSVQYSNDYKQIAVGYDDANELNALIWSTDNSVRPLLALSCVSQVNSFQFNNKDQNQLAGGLSSGQIALWDIRKGANSVLYSAVEHSHKDECTGVAWLQSKVGNELASVGLDGKIVLWDSRKLDEPMELIPMDKDGYLHSATAIDFDIGTSTKFLVGCESGSIFNCNRKGKSSVEKLGSHFNSGAGGINALQRSPFNSKVFLACSNQSIKLWSEDTKIPIWKMDGHYTSGCFSMTRPTVLFASNSRGCIHVFDLAHSIEEPRFEFNTNADITVLKCNDKGSQLLYGCTDGTLVTLKVSDGFYIPIKNEKTVLSGMLDHDSKREKTIETFIKEIKKKDTCLLQLESIY